MFMEDMNCPDGSPLISIIKPNLETRLAAETASVIPIISHPLSLASLEEPKPSFPMISGN